MKTVLVPLTQEDFLQGKEFMVEPSHTRYHFNVLAGCLKESYYDGAWSYCMNIEETPIDDEKKYFKAYVLMLVQKVEFKLKFIEKLKNVQKVAPVTCV
jgi:hypothetical protein